MSKIKGAVKLESFKNHQSKKLVALRKQKVQLQKNVDQRGTDWVNDYHELSRVNLKIKTIKSRIDNYGKSGGLTAHPVPVGTYMSN